MSSPQPLDEPADGRSRVHIDEIRPALHEGRYAPKRVVGDRVVVRADLLADGHDLVTGACRYRHESWSEWREAPLEPVSRDRFQAAFPVAAVGRWRFQVLGWVDRFGTWLADLKKRAAAGQPLDVDLRIGAALVREAAEGASGADRGRLLAEAAALEEGPEPDRLARAASDHLHTLMVRHDPRLHATHSPELPLVVDRERARFSSWYELFPRSWGPQGQHGTFRDLIARLPYVADMGFDVLYLPPIHPIGRTFRKGRNNAVRAEAGDVGSPWAIGGPEGGHKAVHPELGTLDDFQALRQAAEELGLEIALDVALQCSPDHPYVREHPQWFRHRPDGSVQYAENPPKKYQDIYPFDFECADWQALWRELHSIFTFWIAQGVRIFRVDNPHTKSLRFWAWCVEALRRDHPDVILLSEAFTRPKLMQHLAKIGFGQSYTYFAWKNSAEELRAWFTELTTTEVAEYLRPNAWPNTPDILNAYLQHGGRPAHIVRAVLAGTLSASYGLYGPVYELGECTAREPGSEEYLDSEKYELRAWDLEQPHSIAPLLARLNAIRREHRALQWNEGVVFHEVDNPQLLCFSKSPPPGDDEGVVLVVANLDSHHKQSGWVQLDLAAIGVDPQRAFQVHDLLADNRYLWQGARSYVELDPAGLPVHIFRIRHHVRTERDFEYFL